MILWLFTIICSFIYVLIDNFLLSGLKKLKLNPDYEPKRDLTVNVLVCARNEEDNISQCLEHLKNQDYPADKWKLLIANDRSDDDTLKIISKYQDSFPVEIKIITIEKVPDNTSPKKNALSELQKLVDSDIVMTTDADCLVPDTWISSIISEYELQDSDMVIGHSSYLESSKSTKIFWGVQSLDFFSHAAVAAAAVGANLPINSNANNFSYRKKIYDDVSGYESIAHIASGDDDLLMHKFILAHKKIDFCINPNSFVKTIPQDTFKGIWQQRKRWASKTVYYTKPSLVLLTFVFLYYFYITIMLLAGIFSTEALIMGLFAWLIKSYSDYTVINYASKILKKENLMRFYLPTSLIHIPGIVASVLGGFINGFEWKGQKS